MSETPTWNYILIFSDSVGTRDEVKQFVDSRPEITTWYTCMSNAFFIRSGLTAKQLTDLFSKYTNEKGRFIILNCNTDRNGWLPQQAWDFMENEG